MGKVLKNQPVHQSTGPRALRTCRSSPVPIFCIPKVPSTGPRYSSSPKECNVVMYSYQPPQTHLSEFMKETDRVVVQKNCEFYDDSRKIESRGRLVVGRLNEPGLDLLLVHRTGVPGPVLGHKRWTSSPLQVPNFRGLVCTAGTVPPILPIPAGKSLKFEDFFGCCTADSQADEN